MTHEILNPVSLPEDLNPAEQRLAQCLKEGQPCIVGDGSRPGKPIEAEAGCNVIRERVLCFFIFGGNEEHPTRGPAIELYGAYVPREEYIIDIHFTRIPYALIFSNCHFTGKMHLIGVECAELNLAGSRLEKGLIANGLKTVGSVFLSRSFSPENVKREFYAGQEVQLSGAHIGGDLNCEGGEFHNPDGNALAADGLKTGGDVLLNNGFFAEGEAQLIGANIGGYLDCSGGTFYSLNGQALIADRLIAKGDVFFSINFSAEGEVRLSGASIDGDLICVNGKISAQNGPALSAEGLTTGGNVILRDGFSIMGEVRLQGANIGQDFECKGVGLHNSDRCVLNASGIKIRGNLLWDDIKHEKSIVDLSYASVAVLKDNQHAWGEFEVDLRGFTYDHFDNFGEVKTRLDKWLGKRPGGTGFSPLPYEQAAKTLFGMGHVDHAREILLAKERLQTKHLRWWGMRRIVRWVLWDGLAGYGYRVSHTLRAIAFCIAFGWGVFYCADKHERMVPHQPAVLSNAKYQEMTVAQGANPKAIVEELFPEYPEFNALLYSVDVFIPFFALHQEPYWYPKPLDDDPPYLRLLTLWYWFEIAAGWVLTSLLLLSITGLLRPRQESGKSD